VPDFVTLLAREIYPLGVVNAVGWAGPVHTLLRPVLNHQAARAFFRGDRGQLPALVQSAPAAIGREQSLLRRYAARYGGALPEDLHRRVVEETCEYSLKLCVTLMAEWNAREPGSPALADLLERQLQLSQSEHARAILRTLVPLFGRRRTGGRLGQGGRGRERPVRRLLPPCGPVRARCPPRRVAAVSRGPGPRERVPGGARRGRAAPGLSP
jgi:hypothetical protein